MPPHAPAQAQAMGMGQGGDCVEVMQRLDELCPELAELVSECVMQPQALRPTMQEVVQRWGWQPARAPRPRSKGWGAIRWAAAGTLNRGGGGGAEAHVCVRTCVRGHRC